MVGDAAIPMVRHGTPARGFIILVRRCVVSLEWRIFGGTGEGVFKVRPSRSNVRSGTGDVIFEHRSDPSGIFDLMIQWT